MQRHAHQSPRTHHIGSAFAACVWHHQDHAVAQAADLVVAELTQGVADTGGVLVGAVLLEQEVEAPRHCKHALQDNDKHYD